ncbi:MAG: hypothetical protein ABSH34_33315 [Verrucomicrobiota bacterium]|jgi:hypothetical protein
MRDSNAVNVIAGLVVLGASAAILISLRGGFPPRPNPKPHQAAGWMMARQALGLLKPGGQIIIVTRDTAAFKNPATEIQLASFKKELRKTRAVIGSIRAIQIDPLKPVEAPPGDFFELIRHAPGESVIVSFMGPPLLSETQAGQLGAAKPGIVAFCSGSLADQLDLRWFFERGLLQAAVLSRRNPLASQPKDLQGWFDRSFLAVTTADDPNLAARGSPQTNSHSP